MKQEYPKKEKVYVVGTHHYCFRVGEPSEIIGVKLGQPDEKAKPRLVYEVEYSDGVRDEICVSEIGMNYQLLTFTDIKSGKFNKGGQSMKRNMWKLLVLFIGMGIWIGVPYLFGSGWWMLLSWIPAIYAMVYLEV